MPILAPSVRRQPRPESLLVWPREVGQLPE